LVDDDDPRRTPDGQWLIEEGERARKRLEAVPFKLRSPAQHRLLGDPERPTPEQLTPLLAKFANHRPDCYCFVCRALTSEEKKTLDAFWIWREGRKK
jgi:hypothetical protein